MGYLIVLLITSTYFLSVGNLNSAFFCYGLISFILGLSLFLRYRYVKNIIMNNKNLSFVFAKQDFYISKIDMLHLLKSSEKKYRNAGHFDKNIYFVDFLYNEYIRPKIKDIDYAFLMLVQETVLLPRPETKDPVADLRAKETLVRKAFFEMYITLVPSCKNINAYFLMRQLKIFPMYQEQFIEYNYLTINDYYIDSIKFKLQVLYKKTNYDKDVFLDKLIKKDLNIKFDGNKLNFDNVHLNINRYLSIEDNITEIYKE